VAKKKTTKKTAKKTAKTAGKGNRTAKKVVRKKATRKKTTNRKVSKKKITQKSSPKKNITKKKTSRTISTKKKVTTKKVLKKKIKQRVKKTPTTKNITKTVTKKKIRRRRGVSVSDAAREAEVDAQGFVYINGRRVRMIATNGVMKKKKRSSLSKTADLTTAQPINIKTTLTTKQLREYRDRLMKYRARLLTDLSTIEKEALDANSDSSHMPIHMADVGSDAYDQDLKLGMAASERKRIRDIEDAIVRIRKKTYGVCQLTGKLIPEARLLAKPWAKYTLESAEKIERLNRYQ